jgi:hypothetical protein
VKKSNTPADAPIAVGRPHRAWRTLEVQLYEYDALGVTTAVLPAGKVFQPWEPLPHWRGERVPITLGDSATEFDWGVSSPTGHFLAWDDFFAWCGQGEAPKNLLNSQLADGRPVAPPGERWLDPFAELESIGARLRATVRHKPTEREQLDRLLAIAQGLEQAHAHAAEMQRGAEGFDNTATAGLYAAVQARLLAAALELLQACRALAEREKRERFTPPEG